MKNLIVWMRTENTTIVPRVRSGELNHEFLCAVAIAAMTIALCGRALFARDVVLVSVVLYKVAQTLWADAASIPDATPVSNGELIIYLCMTFLLFAVWYL